MKASKCDLLNKQQKKLKKKPRKTKKKENPKALKYMDQFFSQFVSLHVFKNIVEEVLKKYKSGVREGLGKLRAKGKPEVEGMFFKEIFSGNVTKDRHNEENEAEKNKKNRLIDLRRIFRHTGQPRLVRPQKRNSIYNDNQKSDISSGYRYISDESNEDLEPSVLSPISFAFTLEESYKEDPNTKAIKNRKLDLEKEFDIFVSKYEEAVGAHVLYKLPENGVLEDAIEALREIQKTGLTDSKKDEPGTNKLVKEFDFLTENVEPKVLMGEDVIDSFLFSENFLIPKKNLYTYENLMEKSSENLFTVKDVESNDYNHFSFVPIMDQGDGNDREFIKRDFVKPAKDLSIASPPIQFYRRNMF